MIFPSRAALFVLLFVLALSLQSAQLDSDRLVSGIDFSLIDFSQDRLRDVQKHGIDILSRFGRAFHEHESVSLGAVESLIVGDGPPEY